MRLTRAMKKLFFALLFWPVALQAAPVISDACLTEVATKLEFRFTFNPTTGNIYAWERHIKLVGAWNTRERHCYLYWIAPGSGVTAGFPLSNVTNSINPPRLVMNLSNSIWFWTNAINIEGNQDGLNWCTQ